MHRIAFIPLDNRPVCYDLPVDIVSCMGDYELLIPPIEYIGGLYDVADYKALINWFENLNDVDYAVISLDTVAYGSLVASRRCELSLEEIKARIEKLKDIILKKHIKTKAFSSIMRISNNNINEEEKEYWNEYGKKIFDYSFYLHKSKVLKDEFAVEKYKSIEKEIPNDVINDYLKTRKRNFEINKIYLNWLRQGVLDTLVFSKDDCAQYGINVFEANELASIIKKEKLCGVVKTGADEIPLSLLSGIFSANKTVKIYPVFSNEGEKNLISKYEDISIESSVLSQIELSGAQIAKTYKDADLVLYVNNFEKEQGELVMDVETKPFSSTLPKFDKPFFFADVRFANGADNAFVKKLFENKLNFEKFYGYTAWNTSANTLGSAICIALAKYCAENLNKDKFKQLQAIRFLDDWAYQANVRKKIRSNKQNLINKIIYKEMKLFEEIIVKKLSLEKCDVDYSFPWDRFFEVRIKIINS